MNLPRQSCLYHLHGKWREVFAGMSSPLPRPTQCHTGNKTIWSSYWVECHDQVCWHFVCKACWTTVVLCPNSTWSISFLILTALDSTDTGNIISPAWNKLFLHRPYKVALAVRMRTKHCQVLQDHFNGEKRDKISQFWWLSIYEGTDVCLETIPDCDWETVSNRYLWKAAMQKHLLMINLFLQSVHLKEFS